MFFFGLTEVVHGGDPGGLRSRGFRRVGRIPTGRCPGGGHGTGSPGFSGWKSHIFVGKKVPKMLRLVVFLEPWNIMEFGLTFHETVGNGMSSSQVTNSIIFQRGRSTTNLEMMGSMGYNEVWQHQPQWFYKLFDGHVLLGWDCKTPMFLILVDGVPSRIW